MVPRRGQQPLAYRRIGRADLQTIASIELDPEQVRRYLGPLDNILQAVRAGPAHSLVAMEAGGDVVGFYVVHPDRRDAACWWLGWLALDRAHQGLGLGRAAIGHVLDAFSRLDRCRRVRLLVMPDNAGARRLYASFGFQPVDLFAWTGELVLELVLPTRMPTTRHALALPWLMAGRTRRSRHVRLRPCFGPHPAWTIGVVRGPPALLPQPLHERSRTDAQLRRVVRA